MRPEPLSFAVGIDEFKVFSSRFEMRTEDLRRHQFLLRWVVSSTRWSPSRLFRDGGDGILVGDGDEDGTGDEADVGMWDLFPVSVVSVSAAVGTVSVAASGFVAASASAVVSVSVTFPSSATVADFGDDAECLLVKGDGIDVRSRRERYDGDRDSIKMDAVRARSVGKDGLFLVAFVFGASADDDAGLSHPNDAIGGGGMLRNNGLDGFVFVFVPVSI